MNRDSSKTLFNQHIHIQEIENQMCLPIFQSTISSWPPVISPVELWRDEKPLDWLENANAGKRPLPSSACNAAWRNCTFPVWEFLKKNSQENVQSQSKAHPASCWDAFFSRQSSHWEDLEHNQTGSTWSNVSLAEKYKWSFVGKQ